MAKDRKVVYTLTATTDPGAKKSFDEMAAGLKAVDAAAKSAAKSIKEANAERARANSTAGRGKDKGFSAGYDRASANDARRAAADERREREANIKAVAAAEKSAAKEASAALKAKAATERAVNSEAVKQTNRTIQEQQKLNSAVKQTLGGLAGVGRAFVLFGVSGEENIEKAVRALARFEATVSAITGLINLIEGASKAWKAYAAATAAATAAQAAFNATSGAGAVGGAAKFAGGAAAGVAGRGLIGSAVRYIPHVAAATAGFGAGTYAGSRMLGEGDRRNFSRDVGRATDWMGFTDNAGDEKRAVEQRRATIANMAGRRRARYESDAAYGDQESELRIRGAANRGGLAGGIGQGLSELSAARAESERLRAMAGGEIEGADAQNIGRQRELSAEREISTISRIIEMEKERKQLAIEAGQARLEKAQQETSELRTQLNLEKQKRQAVVDSIRGTKEAIGASRGSGLAAAERAAKQLEMTGEVDLAGGDALDAIGITEPGRAARQKAGEKALEGAPALKALLEKLDRDSSKQLKDIQVKVDQAVTGEVKITGDNEKAMKQFKDILDKWDAELIVKLQEKINAQRDDDERNRGLRDGTGGG
jgi:hypothetical protein